MYCLGKLNQFNVNSKILAMFYSSAICCVWKYCLSCWSGDAFQADKDRIDKIIRRAGRVIGECQAGVDACSRRALVSRFEAVWGDESHPLHQEFASAIIPRSGRMRLPAAHTNRDKSSFVPSAINIHNESVHR